MLPGNKRNLTVHKQPEAMADDDDAIDKEIARLLQLKKEKAELKKKQELEAKAKEEEQRIAAEHKKREEERALAAGKQVEGGGGEEAEEVRWRSFYETLLAREVATAGFSFWVDDKPPEKQPTTYVLGLLSSVFHLRPWLFAY